MPSPTDHPLVPGRRPARTRAAAVVPLLVTVWLLSGCATGETSDGGLDATTAQSSDGTGDTSGRGVRGEPADPDVASVGPSGPDTPAALPTFSSGTVVGELAPGFPRKLLGVPDDATVLASSVKPGEGKLTEVTLNLATSGSAQQAIDQVTAPLIEQGFTDAGSAAFSGLTAQTSFTREDSGATVETVVLGVLDDGDRRLVTVSGSVRI